ncbi:MAG: hypothetical protein HYY32_05440 [Chloroflexi bacterium]|nr:hypothetical protein [Chloroflexota bacterium]
MGTAGAVLLSLVYFGVVAAAQGSAHALQQAASLWYLLVPLVIGFGVQVGLFSYLRQGARGRRVSGTASVTASGGVSAGSMVACCAHHLSDVLPMWGIAGVAGFLAAYQRVFLLAGVLSNLVGIAVMLEAVQCMGLPGPGAFSKWDMKKVKRWSIAGAATVLAAASLVAFVPWQQRG